jgi:hypothetical protein
MSGAIPPFHQYTFMVWCSVEAQGHFYLLPLPFSSYDHAYHFLPRKMECVKHYIFHFYFIFCSSSINIFLDTVCYINLLLCSVFLTNAD